MAQVVMAEGGEVEYFAVVDVAAAVEADTEYDIG